LTDFYGENGEKMNAPDDSMPRHKPLKLELEGAEGSADTPAASAAPTPAPAAPQTPPPQQPAATSTDLVAPQGAKIEARSGGADYGSGSKNRRIGETLVEQGIISKDQLQVALHEKQRSNRMVGEILVDLGFITQETLMNFLSETTGLSEFNPKNTMLDPEALEAIPKREAQKYQLLPVSIDKEKNEAIIAMADPYDVVALDKLKLLLPKGCTIERRICPPASIAG